MTRKALALAFGALLLLGACSKKKAEDAKAPETSTTTTVQTTTTEKSTGTTKSSGKVHLGGMTNALGGKTGSTGTTAGSSSSDINFTDAETSCIQEAALADPVLGPLVLSGGTPSTPTEEEILAGIIIDCLGPQRVVDLIMPTVADENPDFTASDLDCIERQLLSLSRDEGIGLLTGDTSVQSTLEDQITIHCI